MANAGKDLEQLVARFEKLPAPSSNTMAAMLAKAPSAATSRMMMLPSSCRMALRRICASPQRAIIVNTSSR